MSTDQNLDEMPEQWNQLFDTRNSISAALALEDLGYSPEDFEQLSEDARQSVEETALEYNRLKHEFQRRDELDREMADQYNEDIEMLESRIEELMGADSGIDRRTALRNLRNIGLALGVVGASGGAAYLGTQAAQNTPSTVESTLTENSQIEDYIEGELIGNQMLEQEWSGLLNIYDSDTGEFFSEEEGRNLQSLSIAYNDAPGEDSAYRLTDTNDMRTDWTVFEHDETAEKALEYFGEL